MELIEKEEKYEQLQITPAQDEGLPLNIMTGHNQMDQETNSMKSLLNEFEGSRRKLYKVKKI